jgi:protein-S-isoprenylcysteine O-methyltransferase Ste14
MLSTTRDLTDMPDLSDIYRRKAPSMLPKGVLAVLHLTAVLAAAWLLFGGGMRSVSGSLGLQSTFASTLRRATLLAASIVYFVRTLLTTFVFLKRRFAWPEVLTIAVWIGALHLLFAFVGGRRTAPLGLAAAGGLLYLLGSYLNTASELQRYLWKRRPENKGRLYTAGLFHYATHINYFGDLVLFTGWVLLAANPFLLVVPFLMLLGFVFLNIPALDRYLADRYGDAFTQYAARTKKLIPFVY